MELMSLFKEEGENKISFLSLIPKQTKQHKKRNNNNINNDGEEKPPQNEAFINANDNKEKINNNTIQINEVKELEEENEDNNIQYRNFFEYLKQKKELYTTLKYDPPVLNYLIENKGKIDIKYFTYKNRKDSFIDHLYDNLNIFLFLLSIDKINFQEEKHGYFCDKVNGKYVEGLYSYIDLKILNEKITTNINFPKDDFKNPNEKIAKNALNQEP